ncbi:MAG: hypothetical protein AABW55_01720 [Thermoproteota archaeon]
MSGTFCPFCKEVGFDVKLELTESMLLICTRCSRAFAVKSSNGKRELYFGNYL